MGDLLVMTSELFSVDIQYINQPPHWKKCSHTLGFLQEQVPGYVHLPQHDRRTPLKMSFKRMGQKNGAIPSEIVDTLAMTQMRWAKFLYRHAFITYDIQFLTKPTGETM
jgi:hypothetical protein